MERINPTILIFLGSPGSGKGTQATLIADQYQWPLVVTGDIMRAEAKKSTVLGKKTKHLIEQGKLVPTALWEKIMAAYFKNFASSKGFIIDGSPRNKAQIQSLNRLSKQYRLPPIIVIYLELHITVATQRLLQRMTCSVCRQPMLPRIKNCSRCGGKVMKRKDDDPRVIKQRFKVYQKETAPLVNYYQTKNELIKINGDQSINQVHRDIVKALKKRQIIV